MEVGKLYKFKRWSCWHTPGALEDKTALYLGEDFIHRDDGVTVENHRVLVTGRDKPTTIDRSLVKYMVEVKA
jgi:hypothetical protein